MNSTTKNALLSGLALALLAGSAAAGEPQATTTTEVKKACNVVMLSGDQAAGMSGLPPHQIMVTSRAVDGGDPKMQVQVIGLSGGEGETIDVNSLAEGETKTFTTNDGRDVIVSRTGEAVTLSVDGKEITLPSLAHVAVMNGEGAPGGATWISAEGDVTNHEETKDVFVFSGEPHQMMMIGGPGAHAGNFDHLKSLEGLDPEVREKVVAALHEILSGGPAGLSFTTTAPAPGEPGAPAAAGQHVIVRRVVAGVPAAGSKVE